MILVISELKSTDSNFCADKSFFVFFVYGIINFEKFTYLSLIFTCFEIDVLIRNYNIFVNMLDEVLD